MSEHAYKTYCGNDIQGHDLFPLPAESMADCLNLCDQHSGCDGVAYEATRAHGIYNCYLKQLNSDITPNREQYPVDAAIQLSSTSSSWTSSAYATPTAYDSTSVATPTESNLPFTTSIQTVSTTTVVNVAPTTAAMAGNGTSDVARKCVLRGSQKLLGISLIVMALTTTLL